MWMIIASAVEISSICSQVGSEVSMLPPSMENNFRGPDIKVNSLENKIYEQFYICWFKTKNKHYTYAVWCGAVN